MMDESLLQDFIVETSEHLEEIEKNLLKLSSGQEDSELLNNIFRSVHTIKGSSEYLGMARTAELSHRMENLLDRMRQKIITTDDKVIETLISGTDMIALLIEELNQKGGEESSIDDIIKQIERLENYEENTKKNCIDSENIDTNIVNNECSSDPESYEENVIYEEDYDKELFEIFIDQLHEGLEALKSNAQRIANHEDEAAIKDDCRQKIKALQSSANYMGYEELSSFYEQWVLDLENNADVSPEKIMQRVKKIVAMFPKAENLNELIQVPLDLPVSEMGDKTVESTINVENDIATSEKETKDLLLLDDPIRSPNHVEEYGDFALTGDDSNLFLQEDEIEENDLRFDFEPIDGSEKFAFKDDLLDTEDEKVAENTSFDSALLLDFISETSENLDEIESNLMRLSTSPDNKEMLNDIFRSIHTIKGSSEYLGMKRIAELSHRMENLLDRIRNDDLLIDDTVIDILIAGRDRIGLLTDELGQSGTEKSEVNDIINQIDTFDKVDIVKDGQKVAVSSSSDGSSLPTTDEYEKTLISDINIVYEEDSDTELFEIFIEQVHEGLSYLKDHLLNISHDSSHLSVFKKCNEKLDSLITSANYMGYDHLMGIYEQWSEELKTAQTSIDTEKFLKDLPARMSGNIEKIIALFPKVNAFEDLRFEYTRQNDELDNEDIESVQSEDDEIIDLVLKVDENSQSELSKNELTASSNVDETNKNSAIKDSDLNELVSQDEISTDGTLSFSDTFTSGDNTSLSDEISKKRESSDNSEIESTEGFPEQDGDLIELSEIVTEDHFKDDQDDPNQTKDLIGKLENAFDAHLDSETEDFEIEKSEAIEKALFSQTNIDSSEKDIIKVNVHARDKVEGEKEDLPFTETETENLDDKKTEYKSSISPTTSSNNYSESSLDSEKQSVHTSVTYTKEMLDSLRAEFDIRNADQKIISYFSNITPEQKNNDKNEKKIASNLEKKDVRERSTEKQLTQSVRVDAGKIDALMNQVGELVVNRAFFSQLYNEMRSFEKYLSQNSDIEKKDLKQIKGITYRLSEATLSLGRVATDLQEKVMRIRMLPISQLFNRYLRLVHDLVKGMDKKVSLDISGEDTELDRMVIEKIADPLVHIIRNSIDHGIETTAERISKGKPAIGKLRLEAYHESNHVVIKIIDDGRGIDLERIKAKAIEKQLLRHEELERMSERELTSMIMQPGFSTAAQVTHTSGRGVGMDVVKKNVEKLNGTIEIESKFGIYTQIRIKIPLTLAIIPALMVQVSHDLFTIPLSNVDETIRTFNHEITSIEGIEVIHLRDENIPLLRLTEVFNIKSNTSTSKDFVVIVKTGDTRVGLVVDELLGDEEVVIKPLEDYLQERTGFSGATILGDGRISLILDVHELISLCKDKQARKKASNSIF